MVWERALKILAFKEALSKEPSYDFARRNIFRWYSKTFATPLHLVDKLPIFDVFQAYYEDHYTALVDSGEMLGISKELSELSKTDEELKAEKVEKDRDDVELFFLEKDLMDDVAAGEAKKIRSKAEKVKIAKEKIERDLRAAKGMETLLNQDGLGAKSSFKNSPDRTQLPEAELPEAELPKEVSLSFTGLDDVADLDGLSPLPPTL